MYPGDQTGDWQPSSSTLASTGKDTVPVSLTLSGPFPQLFLGRYQVWHLLGRGGMASVYYAIDTGLQRPVALKIPHAHWASDPTYRQQFLHEAQAMAQLEHPNICRVFDCGLAGDLPWLTMQYIHGNPLSKYRPTGKRWLEPGEASELVRVLALALAHAHQKGIIHRDLKPANVLLTAEREPILTDFGLALRLDQADAIVPEPGEVVGTPLYLAPEQLRTRDVPLGRGCDIYVLGVILFELLTGRLPFPGPDWPTLVKQILNDPPPRPSTLRPGLPPTLDAICLQALAKNVEERFTTMDDFAKTLAEALVPAFLLPVEEDPTPPCPRVAPTAFRFAFVSYQDRPPAELRERLYLDVGNDLRPGVLDHHHLVTLSGSTTRFVFNRPDLVAAVVAPDRPPDQPHQRGQYAAHQRIERDQLADGQLVGEN
ncbi:MAG: serine/threonine protein kinase, partial [Gemmataceae bacterium]|nr:serine/threonine protein kinase [Gemmataceae bacterium]